MSEVCDVTWRRVPGGWGWWRLHISITARRGQFEGGSGWMYRGLIHRWAKRIGPVNVAFLRLIGSEHEPYRADR